MPDLTKYQSALGGGIEQLALLFIFKETGSEADFFRANLTLHTFRLLHRLPRRNNFFNALHVGVRHFTNIGLFGWSFI